MGKNEGVIKVKLNLHRNICSVTHSTNPQVTAQRGPPTCKYQTIWKMLSLCKHHPSHPEGSRYCPLFSGRPDHGGPPGLSLYGWRRHTQHLSPSDAHCSFQQGKGK